MNWDDRQRMLSIDNRPGLESDASDSEFMMGMKMPPARAVVDGIAGAISASATDRPYLHGMRLS